MVSLSDELEPVVQLESFREQLLDVIGYRVLNFKYSRYGGMDIDG